jgi:hypothetical protein
MKLEVTGSSETSVVFMLGISLDHEGGGDRFL